MRKRLTGIRKRSRPFNSQLCCDWRLFFHLLYLDTFCVLINFLINLFIYIHLLQFYQSY